MIVKGFENAKLFLEIYEAILLEHEAVSQLILYNAYQNLNTQENGKCTFGAVLDEEESTILLFSNALPYHLAIYSSNPNKDLINSATIALADFFSSNHISITGINAKSEVCQIFIQQYKKNINSNFVEKVGMDIMEIRQINELKPVDGKHRPADISEAKLITDWMIQYQIESMANELDYEQALNRAMQLIENHQIYVYEIAENKVVTMAATIRRLVHGMAITYVFTPEEYRGKGYAAANIYYLCKDLLDSGYEFCTLFVDKKNPLSSRAYEKVGFKILEDNYEYQILPAEAPES